MRRVAKGSRGGDREGIEDVIVSKRRFQYEVAGFWLVCWR